jgi:hypothetical protein
MRAGGIELVAVVVTQAVVHLGTIKARIIMAAAAAPSTLEPTKQTPQESTQATAMLLLKRFVLDY